MDEQQVNTPMGNAKTYFTGVSCKNGHVSERYSGDGRCVECVKASAARSSEKNRKNLPVNSVRYSTGKPCRNGHISDRYASTGNCAECAQASNARKRETNRKKLPINASRYSTGRPCSRGHIAERYISGECVECAKENGAQGYKINREKILAQQATPESRKRKNARTRRLYARRLEEQAGSQKPDNCEICGRKNKSGRPLAFDHCHKTGKFRGWLCQNCNTTLGKADDNPALLIKMAQYLEKHRPTQKNGITTSGLSLRFS